MVLEMFGLDPLV